MTRWIPAPLPAIHAANRHRWTTENPAPEVVGYLVVWADLQEGRRPSRRSMAEHLGWSTYQARKLIETVKADLDAWVSRTAQRAPVIAGTCKDESPTHPKQPQRPPVIAGTCGDASPTDDQAEETAPEDDHPAHVIAGTYPGHSPEISHLPPVITDHHEAVSPIVRARFTGTGSSLDLNSSLSLELPNKAGPQLKSTWEQVNELRSQHLPGCRNLKLTKARRAVLKARITEHGGEAVVEVWRWALTSSHHRARFLRDGYLTPDTLHRASKFPAYLDLSRAPPEQTIKPPPTREETTEAKRIAFNRYLDEGEATTTDRRDHGDESTPPILAVVS